MNNFELIDDYLANRLSEADRKEFELKLDGDPSLKSEVELQRHIVEGVRSARVAELKAMLNQVPVGGSSWSAGKAAAALIGAGVITASLYMYFRNDDAVTDAVPSANTPSVNEQKPAETQTPVTADESNPEPGQPASDTGTPKTKTKPASETKSTPVQKPDIQVIDPSEEMTESATENQPENVTGRPEVTASKMEVNVNPNHKKYSFHYQFVEGKLILYGPFDKTLYEVLEINSENHLIFLYYRENYYLLDEGKEAVTSLVPIRDGQLLKKLKDYRGR